MDIVENHYLRITFSKLYSSMEFVIRVDTLMSLKSFPGRYAFFSLIFIHLSLHILTKMDRFVEISTIRDIGIISFPIFGRWHLADSILEIAEQ